MKNGLIWTVVIASVTCAAPIYAQSPGDSPLFQPQTDVLRLPYNESGSELSSPFEPHQNEEARGLIRGALIGAAVGFVLTVAVVRAHGDDEYGVGYGIYIGAPLGAVLGGLVGWASAASEN